MIRQMIGAIFSACIGCCICTRTAPAMENQFIPLNDDGGWCWFQDERVIVHQGKLIVGTVAAGHHDPARRGNIEVVTFDIRKRTAHRTVLHERLQCDDHDAPALLPLQDGTILAMYSKHGNDNRIYFRNGETSAESLKWGPERVFTPTDRSRVTYSNLFLLLDENRPRGRLYNFYRGYDNRFKPSWMTSNDGGKTWSAQGILIDFPSTRRHRPYVKYASDDRGTIHFVFTEGHPRDYNNSIYHAYFRNGTFYDSSGAKIKDLSDGALIPSEATRIFTGDQNNVAWTADLHLDNLDRPVVVYSLQKNSSGFGRRHSHAGQDHRYRYARWDGTRWQDQEIAYAGTRLYPGEDDYTGGICLNPDDPNEVFLSADVNIHDGRPNKSGHYELYQGVTKNLGRTWNFTAITMNSNVDNIRPIVPKWNGRDTAILWLRGNYVSYTNFDLDVVGNIRKPIQDLKKTIGSNFFQSVRLAAPIMESSCGGP